MHPLRVAVVRNVGGSVCAIAFLSQVEGVTSAARRRGAETARPTLRYFHLELEQTVLPMARHYAVFLPFLVLQSGK